LKETFFACRGPKLRKFVHQRLVRLHNGDNGHGTGDLCILGFYVGRTSGLVD
jgi:hypothetical protein